MRYLTAILGVMENREWGKKLDTSAALPIKERVLQPAAMSITSSHTHTHTEQISTSAELLFFSKALHVHHSIVEIFLSICKETENLKTWVLMSNAALLTVTNARIKAH